MSNSLYSFSSETLSKLQKFRFSSGRATSMQAIIYTIDKNNYEVKREDDDEIITSMDDLKEELPPSTPRFILLCCPMKTDDGRMKSPLVLLYWKPASCGQESLMLYAGALEMFRDKAGVSQLIQFEDEDDLDDLEIT